jgi:hypothetical protein
MKTKCIPVIGVLWGLLVISGPVFAHHGAAAFDMQNLTTVKGTVTKFLFINPHALIFFDVVSEKGSVEHWIAEESSNNHLSRVGWTKNTIKVGSQVTIAGHRAKNDAYTLELQCGECSVRDVGSNGVLQQ